MRLVRSFSPAYLLRLVSYSLQGTCCELVLRFLILWLKCALSTSIISQVHNGVYFLCEYGASRTESVDLFLVLFVVIISLVEGLVETHFTVT